MWPVRDREGSRVRGPVSRRKLKEVTSWLPVEKVHTVATSNTWPPVHVLCASRKQVG